MEKQANILSAQQLCIGYKTGHGHVKQVHGDLSFSLRKGELTCLLGANGSGKSTLLRTLSASQPSLSGKILLNGNELSAMSEREISRQIGVVLTDKTQTGGPYMNWSPSDDNRIRDFSGNSTDRIGK